MIGLYKGTSLISRCIEWRTWSPYSHVAWITDNGHVFEAWTDGVRERSNIDEAHTPGTEIELYDIPLTLNEEAALIQFFRMQVGKAYDYRGVMKFISRRDGDIQDKWFCSELVAAAFMEIKKPLLLRIESWKVYPGLIAYSPLLRLAGGVKTGTPFHYEIKQEVPA